MLNQCLFDTISPKTEHNTFHKSRSVAVDLINCTAVLLLVVTVDFKYSRHAKHSKLLKQPETITGQAWELAAPAIKAFIIMQE